MASSQSLPYEFPPISLLAPAADAAGRTSPYRSIRSCKKAWLVLKVNQGNAAPVTFTLLQALDTAGTGSKVVSPMPVWLVENTAVTDALVPQTPAANFTTDATLSEKFVIFELLPEAVLDTFNGFRTIAVRTSASAAANITDATLHILTNFPGQSVPTSY